MWSFNSRAELRLIVARPDPNQGMEQSMLTLNPEALAILARLAGDGDLSALSPEQFEQLLAIGLIVPTDQLPEEIFFEPNLTAFWPRLTPALAQHQAKWPEEMLLGPTLTAGSKLWPPNLLDPQARPVWLWQPAPELSLPFCPNTEIRALLEALQSGSIQAASLEAPLRGLLATAGILRPVAPANNWPESSRQARASLLRNGYAVVRGLLNPLHAAALREYIRDLSRIGHFDHQDEHVQHRHTIYNHPLMQYLQARLQPVISAIVPEMIEPSYSIQALYHGGAELPRHLDRPQCAWNVSLLLDAQPESEPEQAWPIQIEKDGEVQTIRLEIGDLVIYSGTRTPHWRPPLPPRQRVSVGLFHFVAKSFKGKRL